MQRESIGPRPGWQQKVEALGLSYHTIAGEIYWDESACYRFSADEVDRLEAATAELHARALEAVARVVEKRDFARFQIPPSFHELVVRSWEDREPSLYGRMDLSWDGRGEPKLLEYNADTPTALLEASVIQWYWMQDVKPSADQFNSIHEKLVARWQESGLNDRIDVYVIVNLSGKQPQPGRPASHTSPCRRVVGGRQSP